MRNCNGYGSIPNPDSFIFDYCPGCTACAHWPRCQYCKAAAINVGGTLCGRHVDLAVAADRQREEDRVATMRAQFEYYLPEGDAGVSYQDEGPWRSYELAEVKAQTMREFIDAVSISEIDQDGGELRTYGFDDAPSDVQDAILKAAGLTRADVEPNVCPRCKKEKPEHTPNFPGLCKWCFVGTWGKPR